MYHISQKDAPRSNLPVQRFSVSMSVFRFSSIWRTEKLLRESNYQVLAVSEPVDVTYHFQKLKKLCSKISLAQKMFAEELS
jgi:hypothetical protein